MNISMEANKDNIISNLTKELSDLRRRESEMQYAYNELLKIVIHWKLAYNAAIACRESMHKNHTEM